MNTTDQSRCAILENETAPSMMNDGGGYRLLRVGEAAKMLGISVRGLYRLIARGDLPQPVKVGHASRIPMSDLFEYVSALKSSRK